MYKCPVCNEVLNQIDKSYKCLNGHCFDVNKKGFVNLLLANQSHSENPGDSKEMIDARTSFLDKGYYDNLRDKLFEIISHLMPSEGVFCDLACGEGYYTHHLHKLLNIDKKVSTFGVDLSKFGIGECTRKMRVEQVKNINYCIGNLMYLPYVNECMDVVLNCFAPFFEQEFARIIKKSGYFIRVLPNVDHMLELKEILYKEVKLNELKETNLTEFKLVKEYDLRYQKEFKDNLDLLHLFMMTPLYYKSSLKVLETIKKIDNLLLTLSFKIYVYQKI